MIFPIVPARSVLNLTDGSQEAVAGKGFHMVSRDLEEAPVEQLIAMA